jgi:hypothetical protein
MYIVVGSLSQRLVAATAAMAAAARSFKRSSEQTRLLAMDKSDVNGIKILSHILEPWLEECRALVGCTAPKPIPSYHTTLPFYQSLLHVGT